MLTSTTEEQKFAIDYDAVNGINFKCDTRNLSTPVKITGPVASPLLLMQATMDFSFWYQSVIMPHLTEGFGGYQTIYFTLG